MSWSAPGLTIATLFSTALPSPECLGPCRPAEKLCNLCWTGPQQSALAPRSFQNELQNCHNHIQIIALTIPRLPCFHAPPPSKTYFGLHAFQSAAPNIWNKLPIDVKSACSISSFKVHLKTHYIQHTSWLVTWPRASDSLATLRLVRAIVIAINRPDEVYWMAYVYYTWVRTGTCIRPIYLKKYKLWIFAMSPEIIVTLLFIKT